MMPRHTSLSDSYALDRFCFSSLQEEKMEMPDAFVLEIPPKLVQENTQTGITTAIRRPTARGTRLSWEAVIDTFLLF